MSVEKFSERKNRGLKKEYKKSQFLIS